MSLRHFILPLLLAGIVPFASASPMTFTVTVNTSSISGTHGSLDFNFNPGPLVTQAASLTITSFSSDGSLGSPSTIGHATGTLPGTLTFDNGTAFNDYFQPFTYGSTLSFSINLFGPALSSPDGTSTSGSSFAFSLFSDPAGTIPVLTSDATNGFGYVVNVNLDGSTTPISYLGTPSTVPEPDTGSLTLIASTIALAAAGIRKRIGVRSAQGQS